MNFFLAFQIVMAIMSSIEALLQGPAGQQQTSPPVTLNWGGHVYSIDMQVTKVS